ncbi:MAG: EF-hand domain-containing protein [Planctomycetaceae bacterium]
MSVPIVLSLVIGIAPVAQDKNNVTLRQRVIAEYDTDGDGRLNAREREVLQKAGSPFAKKRPRRGRRRFDPATVKKYDKDGDGKLDERESRSAQAALSATWGKLVGVYQAFEKDQPVVENLRKMESDAKAGKIEDFPPDLFGWIRGSIERAGRGRRGRPRGHVLAEFDKNNDGRLDAKELKEARAAIARRKTAPAKPPRTRAPTGP